MSKHVKQNRANPVVEGAVQWAKAGVPVFPCDPFDKSPLTARGFYDAVTDEAAVRALFEPFAEPEVLIGARMGKESGLFVVDFDLYKDGCAEYMETIIDMLPATRTHLTRSGGVHMVYSHDTVWPNVKLHDTVDVKGEGGYVILPPSVGYLQDDNGVDYIEEAPPSLINFLLDKRADASNVTNDVLKSRILSGDDFHDTLVMLSAKLSGRGWPQERVQAELLKVLSASIAQNPKHPRHDRWLHLMENRGGEFARIAASSNAKFNTSYAAEEAVSDLQLDKIKQFADQTASIFSRRTEPEPDPILQLPNKGDLIADWPFASVGYFSQTERDILNQKYVMYPLLAERETVLIAAEPKAGKTAIALKLAMAVAGGESLGEALQVNEARDVLYFTLEGARAVEMRVVAEYMNKKARDEPLPATDRLFIVDRPQNFMDADAQRAVCAKIIAHDLKCQQEHGSALGVIFVDTITKGMPGGDQNSVDDTSQFFHFVDLLRQHDVTATVVFIHHLGKSGAVRGSTNIEAEVDVVASVEKTDKTGIISLNIRRARSLDESVRYLFKLSSYYIGTTAQGFKLNAPIVTLYGAEDVTSAGAAAKLAVEWQKMCKAIVERLGVGEHGVINVASVMQSLSLIDNVVTDKTKTDNPAMQKALARFFTDKMTWTFADYAFKVVRGRDTIEKIVVRKIL